MDSILNIDQSTIGHSISSTPATHIYIFNRIRALFASVSKSKERGYTPSTFSFNVSTKGGRCDECKGTGIITTPLQFMPDVETICPAAKESATGRKFWKLPDERITLPKCRT